MSKLILSFFLIILSYLTPAFAVVASNTTGNVGVDPYRTQPNYVKGRLIVKFNDTVSKPLDIAFKNKQSFASISLYLTSLDLLNEQIKISKIRPLFSQDALISKLNAKGQSITTANLRAQFLIDWEALKLKYPKRTKRMINPSIKPKDFINIYVVDFDTSLDVMKVADMFRKDRSVIYAEPDYLVKNNAFPQDPPNDPNFKDQWNLKMIKADSAWKKTQGDGVVVAVIDTGVDYNHPDLKDNMWVNPCEDLNHNGVVDPSDFDGKDTPCVGETIDGNGYVDDIRGYDFSTCQEYDLNYQCVKQITEDNDPLNEPLIVQNYLDDYYFNLVRLHGTYVSAIISAKANNGINIAGVSPNVKIMPIKVNAFFNISTLSSHTEALNYAFINGADIINNSWAFDYCPHYFPPYFRETLDFAYLLGVVIVFGAGNNSFDIDNCGGDFDLRKNYDKAIIVGAINKNFDIAFFSNKGEKSVDINAPGTQIPIMKIRKDTYSSNEVDLIDGTSFSTPTVSGAIALLIANQNDLIARLSYFKPFTNKDIESIIRFTAYKIYGSRVLDVEKMLNVTTVLNIDLGLTNGQVISSNSNSDIFNIQVNVSGSGFKEGQMYFKAKDSDIWNPLGGRQSIIGNYSIPWPIGSLPAGTYTIKYVATPQEGVGFDKSVDVLISNNKLFSKDYITILSDRPNSNQVIGDYMVWLNEAITPDNYLEYSINLFNFKVDRQNNLLKFKTTSSKYGPENLFMTSDYIFWDQFLKNGMVAKTYYYDYKNNILKDDLPFSSGLILGSYASRIFYKDIRRDNPTDLYETVRINEYHLINKTIKTLKNLGQVKHEYIKPRMIGSRLVFYIEQQNDLILYDFDASVSKMTESIININNDVFSKYIWKYFKNKIYLMVKKKPDYSTDHLQIYDIDSKSSVDVSFGDFAYLDNTQVISVDSQWLYRLTEFNQLILLNANTKKEYLVNGITFNLGKMTVANNRLIDFGSSKFVDLPFSSLTINKTGTGGVENLFVVSSEPNGINCGSQCAASFDKGAQVTLSVKLLDGYMGRFEGWPNSFCLNQSTCTLKLDQDEVLNLKFTEK